MIADFPNKLLLFIKAAAPFSTSACAGPWQDEEPPGTQMPYCVMRFVAPSELWQTMSQDLFVEPTRIQFSFWAEDQGDAFVYANQLVSRLKQATFSVTGGVVLGTIRALGPLAIPVPVLGGSVQPIRHVAVDFRIYLQTSVS